MSNKKWRTAPDADDTPGETAPIDHAQGGPAETETSGGPSDELPAHLRRLPDDYLENGFEGEEPELAPGVYRTAIGGGHNLRDMRTSIGGVIRGEGADSPLADRDVELILRDCINFLWQIVNLTAHVAETVQVGDLRKLVASEMALPGDVVRADGTISRHPDARRVMQTGAASASTREVAEQAEPPADKPKSKSRGASHPFMMLQRLAVQAARLIRQITAGTHPGVHNRVKREARDAFDDILRAEQHMKAMLNQT